MSANVTAAVSDTERVERVRHLLGSLDVLVVRLKREKKGGMGHHLLRPEVREELLKLLAELDELAEREAAHKRAHRALSKLLASMRANARDARAAKLADHYEHRERHALERDRPLHRDPVVELTAFFKGAFARSEEPPPDWINLDGKSWTAPSAKDDPATSRAIYVAVEIARRVFGKRAARSLSSPAGSAHLSKLHDNHERNHGYVKNGTLVKQPLWTPERWASFDAAPSTEH